MAKYRGPTGKESAILNAFAAIMWVPMRSILSFETGQNAGFRSEQMVV